MASELRCRTDRGLSLVKGIVRNDANQQAWNVTLNTGAGGFEPYVSANYANYLIAMTEQGTAPTATGFYVGNLPAVGNNVHFTVSYVVGQGGANSESGDTIIPGIQEGFTNGSGAIQSLANAGLAGGLPTIDANLLTAAKLDPKNIAGTPSGVVSASPSPTATTFTAVVTGTVPYLSENFIRWTTGANAGLPFKVSSYTAGAFVVDTMPNIPTAGDTFTIGGRQ